MNKAALTLVIIGALNWGSIGLFKFDLVAWIFGGQASVGSRIVYTLVGIAGLWCVSLLFKRIESAEAI
ncbi:MAG: DUF378 domain-containing protein [Clostridia bacterium]|nr:DUF378 domain-containing protein [Clostridia bacterium]